MTAVTTTIDGAIAVIRVDNPPVNALSDVVLDGLVTALGSIPGAGGTQRLVTLLGRFRAAELIMTGRLLSAGEAAELGLVTRVTKAGSAFDEAVGLANDLAAAPAVAVQAAKRAVRTADALSLPAALELERREFLATLASDDAREGLGAFLAKRPPAFTHR